MSTVLFLGSYVLCAVAGFVLGFMSRNSRIDSLQAANLKLAAELSGDELRTSRTESRSEPVRPVQPRTAPGRTGRPMYGPEHAADRTEPLPTGVRYVPADVPGDRPVSDQEYADMVRARIDG